MRKPGGLCTRLFRLLNALAEREHTVSYLSLDERPQELAPAVTHRQIPFPLAERSGVIFWLLFSLWSPLFLLWTTLCQSGRVSIVSFGAYYAAIAAPSRFLANARVILFFRSLVFKNNQLTGKPAILRALSDMFEKIGCRLASRCVVMSRAMERELQSFMGREIQCDTLANDLPPVTTEQLAPLTSFALSSDPKVRYLLISGVFDKRKNLLFVLKALAGLREQVPHHQLHLLVAGDGPELAVAKDFVCNTRLESVTFLGWVTHLSDILPHVALVLHPSLHEGAPNSVLEAWSQGVPVLLSDIPELRELANNCEDFLFSLDTLADLIQKLTQIANQPETQLTQLRELTLDISSRYRFDWNEAACRLITST